MVGGELREFKKVLLRESDVKLLNKFLDKFNDNKDTCNQEYNGTVIDVYRIVLDGDTADIKGHCDWGMYSFDKIKQTIFNDFFLRLKEERLEFNQEISKKLEGVWLVEHTKDKFNIGDTIRLKKAHSIKIDKGCLWEFEFDGAFNDDCPSLLNLDRSEYFTLDLDERPFVLELGQLDIFTKGDTISYTYFRSSITFELMKLTWEELELVYLWENP